MFIEFKSHVEASVLYDYYRTAERIEMPRTVWAALCEAWAERGFDTRALHQKPQGSISALSREEIQRIEYP